MAWENSDFCGYDVVTGDKPMDEFSLCLTKIAKHYEERFERKPLLAELLYAFEIVVIANASDVFSDPGMINNMRIELGEK